MSSPIPPLLRAEAITHRRTPPAVLDGVSMEIAPASFTLLSGGADSGAGTLLRVLGLLETPDSGELFFDGQPTRELDAEALLEMRNRSIGYLFAEPFLLDAFSVAENIAMPLFKIACMDLEQARARAGEVLHFTGLSAAADSRVSDLDPLVRQVVSLARALAIAPRLLIVEDAGVDLSSDQRASFAGMLFSVPERLGISVIATSQLPAAAFGAPREIWLANGVLAGPQQIGGALGTQQAPEASAHE